MADDSITYEFLSTDLFERYDTHLVFTGVTRNSKKILQNITENLDKVQPLLDTCDEAYTTLSEQKHDEFLCLLNKSWQQKKLTSSSVTENEKIKEIDSVLEKNETVCAHKLCGAGNGGFFLCFSKSNTLNIPYQSVRIHIESNGVYGRIV